MLLLCGREDILLFSSLWMMEGKSESPAGQGCWPKAMRRLNNIIKGWDRATGRQETETESDVWNNTQFEKMINRALC